jgi:hypothetical protein
MDDDPVSSMQDRHPSLYRDDRDSKFTTEAATPFEEAGFCPVIKLPSVMT